LTAGAADRKVRRRCPHAPPGDRTSDLLIRRSSPVGAGLPAITTSRTLITASRAAISNPHRRTRANRQPPRTPYQPALPTTAGHAPARACAPTTSRGSSQGCRCTMSLAAAGATRDYSFG
jgi:hypothetical protein